MDPPYAPYLTLSIISASHHISTLRDYNTHYILLGQNFVRHITIH